MLRIKNLFKSKEQPNIIAKSDIEIPDNIPAKDFTDALERGIVTRKPSFILNGIKYHTFEQDLSMICANRYLSYQQDMESWLTFGMTEEISKEYINDTIKNLVSLTDLSDEEMVRKGIDDAMLNLRIYQEHQKNLNVVSAILELNSVVFIAPCENPYQIDYDYSAKKIAKWGEAIDSDGGKDLLGFFWRYSSRKDQRWMDLLARSTRHLGKETMTEAEKAEHQISKNILVLAILPHKKLLEDLMHSRGLKNRVRQLQVLFNYHKLRWNEQVSLSIFNTNT